MEGFDIVKIEGRKGDIYDFFVYPPVPIHRYTGYVYILGRKSCETTDFDLLYIGTTNDLPKQLKYRRLKNLFETNNASHILVFRVDAKEEMTMIKDEIVEKYPSIKEVSR